MRTEHPIRWLLWGVAAVVAGLSIALVYTWAVVAGGPACGAGEAIGGRGGTVGPVLLVGCLLLAAGALWARKQPRRRGWLFLGFGVVYAAFAAVLWLAVPDGPIRCMWGTAPVKTPPSFLASTSHGRLSVGGFDASARSVGEAVAYFGGAAVDEIRVGEYRLDSQCVLRWSKIGVTLGGEEPHSFTSPCYEDYAVRVVLLSDPRWHTQRGLHVGDPVTRLQRLYPRALQRRGGWHLQRRLAASVSRDRVKQLIVVATGQTRADAWLPGGDHYSPCWYHCPRFAAPIRIY